MPIHVGIKMAATLVVTRDSFHRDCLLDGKSAMGGNVAPNFPRKIDHDLEGNDRIIYFS